jgi:hypothetical protein
VSVAVVSSDCGKKSLSAALDVPVQTGFAASDVRRSKTTFQLWYGGATPTFFQPSSTPSFRSEPTAAAISPPSTIIR